MKFETAYTIAKDQLWDTYYAKAEKERGAHPGDGSSVVVTANPPTTEEIITEAGKILKAEKASKK